jgi:hypothetical protein
MARPPAFKARVQQMIAALEAAGHPVTGMRLCTNGDVCLTTEPLPRLSSDNDDGDWVDLAGTPEISRA